MDIKQAVSIAKQNIIELFGEEGLINVGLEEVERDGAFWHITIGFSRPWNSTRNALTAITGEMLPKRAYRVVSLSDDDGNLLSIKRRDAVTE